MRLATADPPAPAGDSSADPPGCGALASDPSPDLSSYSPGLPASVRPGPASSPASDPPPASPPAGPASLSASRAQPRGPASPSA